MTAIITAELVRSLRERTGSPMMECKRALEATGGDIEKALAELRKSGRMKADAKAERVAKEGVIIVVQDGKRAMMIEVNSETDFVARDSAFADFVKTLSATAWQLNVKSVDALSPLPFQNPVAMSVEEARLGLIAQVGENIQIRRLVNCQVENGIVGTYLHGQRIGVIVALNVDDQALARDIAMHIAASKPVVISPEDVPAALLEKEKEIYQAQAASSGKPKEIVEKMVQGRVKKYLDEVSLLGQPFVKDPNQTVGNLLAQRHAKVLAFYRYAIGEEAA
ncbi:MAG: translation elongation factor Ts [Gammaproteobacteria bacterium RIFCSPHIGHO2_12_FULL_42_10]|nr:MAG: translation elongation factor Ts [Gammaproteobacteria bacterium RIFCSPHIGHO2_12_FULL_42_10]